jgi:transglutaminase-like putative cysteine protease
MVLLALAGCAGAVAIHAARRSRARVPAAIGAAALVLAALLLIAGVSRDLLVPDAWGSLASGIGQGIEALPGLGIPYRGSDEWTRIVILAGGGLLVAVAGLLALWDGRGRLPAAAVMLACLYAVPVVERDLAHQYLDGAAFAVLLGALLWADRLRTSELGLAAALLGTVSIVGLAAAPRVDASRPWLDIEKIAEGLDRASVTEFSWNHTYEPLRWPRDGREVLRIKAARATYWKAVALEEFDGLGWRRARDFNPADPDTEIARVRAWRQELRVVVKGLRSQEYVAAGTTEGIDTGGRPIVVASTPGTFVTGQRLLRRGDAYKAKVYVPRPDENALRTAGDAYPDVLSHQLTMSLPIEEPDPTAPDSRGFKRVETVAPRIQFPIWGNEAPALAVYQYGYQSGDGVKAVRESPYRRLYDLAQRIKGASATPYDFARRVQRRVQGAATYSESPPPARVPLDAFMFETKRGYCQQFSGAMALLLRMGGVPARVASGFTPGTLDRRRREYVVRDLDAHSWVEAYFPGYGWIAFDPTPVEAPPRSQASSLDLPNASGGDATDAGGVGDRGSDPGAAGSSAVDGPQRGWVAGAFLAAVAALLGAVALIRRRRSRDGAGAEVPAALQQLHRALVRTGRAPQPGTTLARLEALLGTTPAAGAYVRALRLERYGGAMAKPGARERRALRRALVHGLGFGRRPRGYWAVPPRPRDAFKARRQRPYNG